jgi:hypothetical protein
MTLIDRIAAELTRAGPLTTAAVARAILPDAEPAAAANAAGTYLRRMKARGLVRSRTLARRGRGKPPLEWTLVDPAAPDAGAGSAPGTEGRGRPGRAERVARGESCGRVRVPAADRVPLMPVCDWVELAALTPDTEPAAIAAAQRADVAAALPGVLADWDAVGCVPTADQLADCLAGWLDLPAWNVGRALAVLRGETLAEPVVVRVHDPVKAYRSGLGSQVRPRRNRKEVPAA